MSEKSGNSAGWQLDQRAPEAYEQYLVPPIFDPWAERLINVVDPNAGENVVDIACGTGIVARRAASQVGEDGSVTGIDINEGMLTVAEDASADTNPGIEWHQGDVTDLPFSDGRFDVGFCQQALQFFDDPVVALGEIRRVLSPGGRAVLSVWRPLEYQPAYVILSEALERHIGEDAGMMMRSPFPDWDRDDLRGFAREAGFEDVSITIEIGGVRYPSTEEFVRREAASSPLAEPIGAVEQAVRDELVQEVENELNKYTDDKGIVFPMESYILTVNR